MGEGERDWVGVEEVMETGPGDGDETREGVDEDGVRPGGAVGT